MNMGVTESLIWILIWCVLFYFILAVVFNMIASIWNYFRSLGMVEVNTIINRDKGICRVSQDGKRCENHSQHMRHIGGIFTPRLKQWIVVCPKHLYVPLSIKQRRKIIESLWEVSVNISGSFILPLIAFNFQNYSVLVLFYKKWWSQVLVKKSLHHKNKVL